jgi:hypothetical protein
MKVKGRAYIGANGTIRSASPSFGDGLPNLLRPCAAEAAYFKKVENSL